jgi:hypothetical protein
VPEGKPYFTLDVIALLLRNGITLEEAENDFEAGRDAETLVEGTQLRVGELALYRFRYVIAFGRKDIVVDQVWLRG